MSALVFEFRGNTQYQARYGAGGIFSTQFNSSKITTSAAGLSGTIIDLTDTSGVKFLSFPGAYNTPNGRAISINMRMAPGYTGTPAGQRAIWCLSAGVGASSAYLELRHDNSTGNLTIVGRNETNATSVSGSFGAWSPTSGTYYDLTFTWDGTTSKCHLYIDGSELGTGVTPTTALSSSWANTWYKSICLGTNINSTASAYKLDEFTIWDYVIDPTSVALNSGTGSLNGASRASLVSSSSFDGTVNVDPGVANVRNGTSYTIAGASLTGTCAVPVANNVRNGTSTDNTTGNLVVPTASQVKTGITFESSGGQTGTYTGSDRWTDPGQANVRLGTAYKADSTTNNKTGTLELPAIGDVRSGIVFDNDDKIGNLIIPDPWDIRSGIQYDSAGVYTGELDLPAESDVKTGVSYDSNTAHGTYDGSDRWTDPGVANVRASTAYKANSATNNRTGTAIIPSASDVRSGTSVDAGTGTLDLPSVANVKTGVTFDGSSQTGSYDGSDRWTDPGDTNVRSGTVYKANSTTNNKTGSSIIPAAGDVRLSTSVDAGTGTLAVPAAGDVRLGVAVDAGTGTMIANLAADVRHGVSSDGGVGTYRGSDLWDAVAPEQLKIDEVVNQNGSNVTGTYDGSDRWSDVPEDKVQEGYSYQANSATENRTGTLAILFRELSHDSVVRIFMEKPEIVVTIDDVMDEDSFLVCMDNSSINIEMED